MSHQPGSEMDKAVALASALQLLMSNHAPHIWVWAMREALKPTQMGLFHRTTVQQLVQQHADTMMRVTYLYQNTNSTMSPEANHLYPIPSSTS
jgi:hypothetical protein